LRAVRTAPLGTLLGTLGGNRSLTCCFYAQNGAVSRLPMFTKQLLYH